MWFVSLRQRSLLDISFFWTIFINQIKSMSASHSLCRRPVYVLLTGGHQQKHRTPLLQCPRDTLISNPGDYSRVTVRTTDDSIYSHKVNLWINRNNLKHTSAEFDMLRVLHTVDQYSNAALLCPTHIGGHIDLLFGVSSSMRRWLILCLNGSTMSVIFTIKTNCFWQYVL